MQTFLSLCLSLHVLLLSVFSFPTFFSRSIDGIKTPAYAEQQTQTSDKGAALSSSITAPGAVLMEASTGTIIFEKDSHTKRHPASITKIMTLILIFEALEQGRTHLDDTVTVSEHAASMGGSQVFLEPLETQSVETMIKCISIASANDACVAFIYRRH